MFLIPESSLPDKPLRYTEQGSYIDKLNKLDDLINDIFHDHTLSRREQMLLVNQLQMQFQTYLKQLRSSYNNDTENVGTSMGGNKQVSSSSLQDDDAVTTRKRIQQRLAAILGKTESTSSVEPLKPQAPARERSLSVSEFPKGKDIPIDPQHSRAMSESEVPALQELMQKFGEFSDIPDQPTTSKETKDENKPFKIPVRLQSTHSPNRQEAVATRTRTRSRSASRTKKKQPPTPPVRTTTKPVVAKQQKGKGLSQRDLQMLIKFGKELNEPKYGKTKTS